MFCQYFHAPLYVNKRLQHNNMTKIINKHLLKTQFTLFALIIITVVSGLSIYFARVTYLNNKKDVTNKLNSNSLVLETNFIASLEHTEYMMLTINKQIKTDPNNKEHINNILNKFKVNPNIANLLAWTIFSWADHNDEITVDALYGIMEEPYDLSSRDYLKLTKSHPDKLKLGMPVYGSTSKRWMIPGGVGLIGNNNNYLGSLTIGFDIATLTEMLKSFVNSDNVKFALIDENKNVLLQSSSVMPEIGEPETNQLESKIHKIILESQLDTNFSKKVNVNLMSDGSNYIVRKIKNKPYYLFVSYNSAAISSELWDSLISRIIEIFIISITFLLLLLLLYTRVVSPLIKLSSFANSIVKGQMVEVIPQATSYETRNLSIYLRKLKVLMDREKNNYLKLQEAIAIAEESDKARESFTRKVRNELKCPLNTVSGVIELLTLKRTNNLDVNISSREELKYLRIAYKGITQLNTLISDEINCIDVDIVELLDDCVTIKAKSALNNGLELNKRIPANLPSLYTDEIKLKQLITGLLSRAIDFSPSGSRVTITAKTNVVDGGDKYLEVLIKDNGLGFDNKTRMKWKNRDKSKGISGSLDGTDSSFDDIDNLVTILHGQIYYTDEVTNGSEVLVLIPYRCEVNRVNSQKTQNKQSVNVVQLF